MMDFEKNRERMKRKRKIRKRKLTSWLYSLLLLSLSCVNDEKSGR